MSAASEARAEVLAGLMVQGIGQPEIDAAGGDLADLADALIDDFQEGEADPGSPINDVTYDEIMGYIENEEDVLHTAIVTALGKIA